ncbi:hypothetical protein CK203_056811 [Vitis vinifera]|uniref:Uncharacterized protein n=1 Tax=Vitis vinifera TaxID=29760 RepID=A0A438GQ94_VITVI|nr:hypothetical protein CK203_056811 [Vitis vinifera]
MIDDTKQKDLSVTVYYNTLKVWWQELDLYQHIEVESTAYATRLAKMIERDQIFDLLPGLNPQLDHVRGQILGKYPFPSLHEVYSYVRSKESRRGCHDGTSSTREFNTQYS